MKAKKQKQLIRFLLNELEIPQDSIQLAMRHCQANPLMMPMILWQYGLVNLQQLERIWDWIDIVEVNLTLSGIKQLKNGR